LKEKVLSRYDFTPDGKAEIATRVNDYRVLFRKHDNSVSFVKRDLDPDFVEYILECLDELGSKVPFVLKISLPNASAGSCCAEIRESIKAYFIYMIALCRRGIKKILNRIFFQAGISLGILTVVYLSETLPFSRETLFYKIVHEGLNIVAWVMLWPVFSEFIYNIRQEAKQIKIYNRILAADILFDYYEKEEKTSCAD
jgi:hypothetical protein